MADKKISELTNITGANLADGDELVVVDTSASETKAITFGEFKTALDTSTGFVRITGDTMTGNLSFGDNDKAIFGAGSDLQVYHSGADSFIIDSGTGSLNIRGTNFNLSDASGIHYLTATSGAEVSLKYAGGEKLATTSTGIDVTGTVTADGLTVGTSAEVSSSSPDFYLLESDTTDVNARFVNNFGDLNIQTANDAKSSFTNRIKLDHATGDISFYEDTGTTAKFFWDASAESLGIGTSSPASVLEAYDTSSAIVLSTTTTGYSGFRSRSTSGNFYSAIDDSTGSAFSTGAYSRVIWSDGAYPMVFGTNAAERMRIDSSGILSFSETSSASFPARSINAYNNGYTYLTGGASGLILKDAGASGSRVQINATTMQFETNGSEAMRIDSSGNLIVGGTTDGAAGSITLQNDGDIRGVLASGAGGDTLISAISGVSNGYQITVDASNNQNYKWHNGGTPSMTLDSSGNLLVGKTALSGSTAGTELFSVGLGRFVRSGGDVLNLNRLSSDGTIIDFQKDGSSVGRIGAHSTQTYIGTGDTGIYFNAGNDSVDPYNTSTPVARSDAISLGAASRRFKDLYLSGGVYLGGTGSANKLDDYEEGTWTPTLTASSMGTSITYSSNTYVKVGKIVQLQAVLTMAGTSGNTVLTDYFQLGGLPFTNNNMGNGVWWQSTSYATGVRNSGHCMVAGSTIYGGCEYANSVGRQVNITLSLTYEATT